MTPTIRERRRCAALWLCLAIFMARVIGQIEALLLAPRWLPPFSAWESGWLPYPVLLPLQIVLIGGLAAIACDHSRGSGPLWVSRDRTRRRLNASAAAYAGLMLLRLAVTAALPQHSVVNRGLIPILAHWDLAGFIALLARTPTGSTAPADELQLGAETHA
ncbi:MAG: hypothetical protein ABSG30_08435 [Steroidobacteraceae bacterium]